MAALLEQLGQRLIDIEDGRALPPSVEGLAHCRALLDAAREEQTPEEVEECGRDLIAYVLTFQDQGLPVESAVQTWAEEWSLDG